MLEPSGNGHRLLSGWGRTAPTRAAVIAARQVEAVAETLRSAPDRGAIARGLGRSYGDAAQNAGGKVIEMTGLASLRGLDLERAEVRVDAGMSLDSLIRLVLPLGLFPTVVPGTRHVTVGGAIAADIHGKNHHREGAFCDHVPSLTLLTPGGERLALSPDDEAFWATAGGMGLTGVILEATLRLSRLETDRIRQTTERARDLDDVLSRMETGDHRFRYSVAWIDCLAGGRSLGRSVLMRGDDAGLDELPASERGSPLSSSPRTLIAAPGWAPSGLLRRWSIRAFNELWFRRAPRFEADRLEPLHGFFFPLDGIRDWNRLYGRHGFLQYQLVVPFGREDALRAALERLSRAGCPSFLAVLKRFGAEHGTISFPMPGWTLALDIPAATPGLGPLLDGLDDMVAAAGGRVYLAKDSRLRPDALDAMYPKLHRWREQRASLDPRGVMRSDLARRLGLVESTVTGAAA